MAVIYLFDARKKPQKAVRQVEEIIHNEGEYNAVTMIYDDPPEHGGFFGFKCMDGRFRMFQITMRETDDETGICTLTGTDAALAELNSRIVTRLSLTGKTAQNAVKEAISGFGWTIGKAEADGEINTEDAYFATAWAALKTIAAAGRVRIIPYYEFNGSEITGRKVDIISWDPVWSGLIYTRKKGAQNINISEEGTPKGRVYGIGKIIGDTEPPEQVTFAEVEWSTANGDPADKPLGQEWIALPGTTNEDGYVYEDKKETDPLKLMKAAFEDLKSTQQPKASGTANLSEMEHMPGYEHMAAHMWMQIAVRTERGLTVLATITNIERYHVHRELTKISIGDDDADLLENQLASMETQLIDTAKVAGGGAAGAGKAQKMVLEAEELIQLNSKKIEANADQITLRAFDARVDELEDLTNVEFQEVYLDIDTNRAMIAATDQKVDNINNEVTGLAAELTVQADQIKQRAYQYEMDELGNRVAIAEGELIVQAGEISAKVSRDGVIGAINLTPEEAVIEAERINLKGYVTASAFEAELAVIDNVFAGYSEISGLGISGNLYAQNANFPGNVSLLGRVTNLVNLTMGSVASQTIYGAGTNTSLSLQHSHSVSVSDDGTVTFGEVSSSGGSFKVADTKAYKDGVSAAYANGKQDWAPVDIERTSYSTADKTVTVRAVNAAGVPLLSLEKISASEIYTAGDDAGYTRGYNTVSLTQGEWDSNNTKRVTASNQKYVTVDARSIYTNGYNAGYAAAGSYDDGYDDGYEAAKDDVVVGYSSLTVTSLSAYKVRVKGTVWANVDGVRVASASISKDFTINPPSS